MRSQQPVAWRARPLTSPSPGMDGVGSAVVMTFHLRGEHVKSGLDMMGSVRVAAQLAPDATVPEYKEIKSACLATLRAPSPQPQLTAATTRCDERSGALRRSGKPLRGRHPRRGAAHCRQRSGR